MATPIIFIVTNAGKNAALDAAKRGLSVSLTRVSLGSAKWTADKTATALKAKALDFTTIEGDIEPNSNTLRFSVTFSNVRAFDAYEMGVYTDTGVLFAVASSATKPLIKLHPEVAIVIGSFGLHLGDIDGSRISLVSDPNSPLAVKLMENHNAAPDPHPQYLKKNEFDTAASNLTERITVLENRPPEAILVGGIYITTVHYQTGEDVSRALGYGTWKRYGKGMVLVGHDPDAQIANNKTWWSSLGTMAGEYQHTLSVAEMPEHKHSSDNIYNKFSSRASESGAGTPGSIDRSDSYREIGSGWIGDDQWNKMTEQSRGGNQPHNNVQPSIVVAMWVRVADENAQVPELYRNNDASQIYPTAGNDSPAIAEMQSVVDKMKAELERLKEEMKATFGSDTGIAEVVVDGVASMTIDYNRGVPPSGGDSSGNNAKAPTLTIKDFAITDSRLSGVNVNKTLTGPTPTGFELHDFGNIDVWLKYPDEISITNRAQIEFDGRGNFNLAGVDDFNKIVKIELTNYLSARNEHKTFAIKIYNKTP